MSVKKPNILLLFDWFYPDYSAGGPVRSCINLIEQTKKDINWYVLTSNTNYQTKRINPELPIKSWEKLPFGGQIMYVLATESNAFLKQVFKSKKWKSIYVNSMYSAFFGFQAVSTAKQLRLNTIVCPRGMLASGSVKQKWWLKVPFLKMSKALGWYSNVQWHATNNEEAKQIKRWYKPPNNIEIIPNVVGKPISNKRTTTKQPNQLRLLCVARVSPEKNIQYILDRLVNLQLNNVTLTIVGSEYNIAYANKLKQLAAKHGLNVMWQGYLAPEALEASLLHYDLFILPTLGENFGHAITEALRAGLPVLISDKTPWKALSKNNAGFDINLNEPHLFEEAIKKVYQMSEADWLTMHEGARTYFKQTIMDASVPKKYIQLFTNKQ